MAAFMEMGAPTSRLGLLLDKRLTFDRHVEEMILRANKGIGLITSLVVSACFESTDGHITTSVFSF